MDPKALLKLARKEVTRMARVLGVDRWDLLIRLGDDADTACVMTLPEYQRAILTLNPAGIADEAQACALIRHELMHVVSSPLDFLAASILAVLKEGSPERTILEEQFRQVSELLAVNLEQMYQSILKHRDPGGKRP